MRMPYVMSWSGGFQWGFRQNWVFEMMYQGQSGVGLINNWDMNVIPLNISSDPAVLNNIFTQTQNFKPYPQFGSVNLFSNFGHNSYHSATARVEKRYCLWRDVQRLLHLRQDDYRSGGRDGRQRHHLLQPAS